MNTRNLRFRSNRVRDIVSLFHEDLDGQYGSGEVAVFLDMLFDAFLGWDKVKLLTSKELTIDQSDLLRFHWALEDLKRNRPIQHIIGYTDFCGCRIMVSPDVLIPRPETEEIVQWIISTFNIQHSTFNILDLCTGSGCIAIALKKAFPQASVTAIELSDKALCIARKNAQDNGADIHFQQADVLAPQFSIPNSQFSIIISNPPYVMASERTQMQPNVLDYDPAMALFVPDDDPLLFYKAIALAANKRLAPDGLMVLEINEKLASETCVLLHGHGFSAEVHDDFRGKHRWISAKKI